MTSSRAFLFKHNWHAPRADDVVTRADAAALAAAPGFLSSSGLNPGRYALPMLL